MSDDLIREILAKGESLLSSIAEKLGQTATHVYEVLVRQQFVDGISGLLWGILLLVSAFACYHFYRHIFNSLHERHKRESFYSMENTYFASGILTVIFAGFLITVMTTLTVSVKKLINPEYYAITYIIDQVNPKQTQTNQK